MFGLLDENLVHFHPLTVLQTEMDLQDGHFYVVKQSL